MNMCDKHIAKVFLTRMNKKNYFVYMRHACSFNLPTFSQSNGALDTRANQVKPQLAVSNPDKINWHGYDGWGGGREKRWKCGWRRPCGEKKQHFCCKDLFWIQERDDMLQTQVLCKTCLAAVATSRGNTANLHHHLQYNHKDLHEKFKTNIYHH